MAYATTPWRQTWYVRIAMSFLREPFIQRLPPNVRMVLASAGATIDLYKLTDMADNVMEVTTPTVSAICDTSTDVLGVKQLREEVAHLNDLYLPCPLELVIAVHLEINLEASNAIAQPHLISLQVIHSAGIMLSLEKLHASAKNLAPGETPRSVTSSDRCYRPNSQSPLLCK